MFKKSKKKAAFKSGQETGSHNSQPQPAGIPSIISVDLILRGDLESIGDIQVDGQVYGDVKSRSVTIGDNAKVTGSITAEIVRVCGRVEGQIDAKSVVLTVSSKVVGDIVHETLEVEAGAFIHGHCRRREVESEQRLSDAAAEIIANGKGKSSNLLDNKRSKGQTSPSAASTGDSASGNVENLAGKKSAVGD